MELLVLVVLLAVAGALLWRTAAFVLGAFAWVGLALVLLSTVAGVPVPGAAVFGSMALWFGSQVVSRMRNGYWRSRSMQGLANAMSLGRPGAIG